MAHDADTAREHNGFPLALEAHGSARAMTNQHG
jgi:hypothetical protein